MKKGYIYSIRNLKNNKRYVGSSINVLRRRRYHFSALRNNNHSSKKLQNAYNKHGEASFVFEIIEEFPVTEKREQFDKEKVYIDLYDSFKNGYNCCDNPYYSGGMSSWTEDQKNDLSKKISNMRKGTTPSNFKSMQRTRWRPIVEFEGEEFIREYESAGEAGRILDIDYRLINNVLRGKTKKVLKFPNKRWRYKI